MKGQFGTATDNFAPDGRIIERTTYSKCTWCAVIQCVQYMLYSKCNMYKVFSKDYQYSRLFDAVIVEYM